MFSFDAPKNKILDISFNQDQDCFVVSTETGFHIYETYPLQKLLTRDFGAGIGITTMLNRTNILTLIGGGNHPKYPDNKVIIWDESIKQCITELTFKSSVKSIKLRKQIIVVVLEQRVYIYLMDSLKLLDVIDTSFNPQGACALTTNGPIVLLCPGKKKGYVRVRNFDQGTSFEYRAHTSNIGVIVLNHDGKLCVTASDKGTIFRIYALEGFVLLQELRRGTEKADIYSIAFDKESQWLACTSDRSTVHIFSLTDSFKAIYESKELPGKEEKKDVKLTFNFMKGITSYFSSQRSFAQLRIPDTHSIVAFGPKGTNTLIVVSYEGRCYTVELNTKSPGECKKYIKQQLF